MSLILPMFSDYSNFIFKKITYQQSFKVPVVCFGNIYLGGTGKTPLSIFVSKELILRKKRPAIIKKFKGILMNII